jgi:hypothetical protein
MSIFINGFLIDATVSETHEFSSEVTEHPVENGADVTDNVRARPIRITMDCVVSDTPIGFVRDVRGENALPSDDAYALLIDLRDSREPVDIETSLRTFENMVLESLSIPRSPQNGDALRFTASFVQIQLVTNARTTVRTAAPRGQKARNLGNKPVVTQPTPSPTVQTSAGKSLDRLLNG